MSFNTLRAILQGKDPLKSIESVSPTLVEEERTQGFSTMRAILDHKDPIPKSNTKHNSENISSGGFALMKNCLDSKDPFSIRTVAEKSEKLEVANDGMHGFGHYRNKYRNPGQDPYSDMELSSNNQGYSDVVSASPRQEYYNPVVPPYQGQNQPADPRPENSSTKMRLTNENLYQLEALAEVLSLEDLIKVMSSRQEAEDLKNYVSLAESMRRDNTDVYKLFESAISMDDASLKDSPKTSNKRIWRLKTTPKNEWTSMDRASAAKTVAKISLLNAVNDSAGLRSWGVNV